MATVAPGTIPTRVPRPLTDAERKRIRKANGGFASADKLAELEAAFAKPERKPKRTEVKSKDQNGWGK